MSRPALLVVAGLALSVVAGCAGTSQQAVSHSLAAQVPAAQIAAQPPTDFEIEFVSVENTRPRHKAAELTSSLRADSPTRTNNE